MKTNVIGTYDYDYEIKRYCDIINDFTVTSNGLNLNYTFACGIYEYKIEELTEIILSSSLYSPFRIRIRLDEVPKENKEIVITYNKFLCNKNLSYYLFNNNIITKSITHDNGNAIKNT